MTDQDRGLKMLAHSFCHQISLAALLQPGMTDKVTKLKLLARSCA